VNFFIYLGEYRVSLICMNVSRVYLLQRNVIISSLLFLVGLTCLSNAETQKKGACITFKYKKGVQWHKRVESLNVSWHYSWSGKLVSAEPEGVEFVPMIWGFWGANDGFKKNIERWSASKKEGEFTHLLGFNEPDGKKQANLTVEKALAAWPHLEKTGLKLGSPGAVHADNAWMKEFMKKADERNLRVDFVCVHWYGGANVNGFINRLRRIHKLYGKPIWITEFAVADWQAKSLDENKYSKEKVYKFMKEVLPKLDKLDFVERYSWFNGSTTSKALGNSALFNDDGSLTKLGELYAKHD